MTEAMRAQLLAIYADEYRDHIAALRHAVAVAPEADMEDAYRHAHSLKGAARAVDLDLVTEIAHALEGLVEDWWEGRAAPDAGRKRLALRALDAIEDLSAAAVHGGALPASHPILAELGQSNDSHPASPEPAAGMCRAAAPPAAPQTLRVETDTLDRLAEAMAGLSVEVDRLGEVEQPLRQLQQLVGEALTEGALRPAHEVLSQMRALITETLHDLAEREWALAVASTALTHDARRLRMVAADDVLGGFGPMVRELAAEEGKRVNLQTEGMATLADREVLHALAEAALHLLRNAVHHGIETPEDRRAAGKEADGHLTLSVVTQGSKLVLQVGDDGRGIDIQAVKRVAAARGLVAESDRESLQQLIFLPGFSTASSVTTGAGRGMGTAIVQAVATRLQGRLELDSTPDRGTRVTLTVPLTFLTQPLLLLKVREEVLALPVSALSGVYALSADQLISLEGGTVAIVDGVQTRLADLGALLALPGRGRSTSSACVAVVNHGPVRLGLVADCFLDVQEFTVAALDPPLADDERLAGTVMLDDGRLALVLVPAALLALVAPQWSGGPPPTYRRTVLVVDDSPTTRMLERDLLETHGYGVVLAADGREALEKMMIEVPWAVVSDVEMPGLSGFGLLAAMRDDPQLARVPVVVVSSRDSPADRARGMAFGAAAYLSKTRFDQDLFLNTIKGLK